MINVPFGAKIEVSDVLISVQNPKVNGELISMSLVFGQMGKK